MAIALLDKEHCTGCLACLAKCRHRAIKIVVKNGFLFPEIDSARCNNCGLCREICPLLKQRPFMSDREPDAYILETCHASGSSSGGFCTALAHYVIGNGGLVAGCVMVGLRAHHILTDNKEDIERMRGSKYVQSELGDVYNQVKKALSCGRTVLFTGTPCQVEAVKKVVGVKRCERLVTVDLICHGVTSAEFLEECVRSGNFPINNAYEVTELSFRSRRQRDISDFTMDVRFTDSNGKIKDYSVSLEDNLFYRGFAGPALREACVHCIYAGAWPRPGDFTCGDPWGVLSSEDCRGRSLVFTNTARGAEILRLMNDSLVNYRTIPFAEVSHSQPNLMRPSPVNPLRYGFIRAMAEGRTPGDILGNPSALRSGSVGLLNFSFERANYGAVLTCVALATYIKEAGYGVSVIDYYTLWAPNPARHKSNAFDAFRYSHLPLTHAYLNDSDLSELNEQCSTFVVGSDQVLNFSFVKNERSIFYLNFVRSDRRTIVYAGSFGREAEEYTLNLSSRDRKFSSLSLKRMNAVSVRERKSGLEICRSLDVKAEAVCDPVFLLTADQWKELSSKGISEGEEFVTYSLYEDSAISRLSIPQGYLGRRDFFADGKQSPYDWLKAICKCRLFVTNSFHGVCFALIFNRPFLVYGYSQKNIVRIRDLLDDIDSSLKCRIVTTHDQDIPIEKAMDGLPDPDWSTINKSIASLAKRSGDFLLTQLSSEFSSEEINRKHQLKEELRASEVGVLRHELLKFRIKRTIYHVQKTLLPTARNKRHYDKAKKKVRLLKLELRYMDLY